MYNQKEISKNGIYNYKEWYECPVHKNGAIAP